MTLPTPIDPPKRLLMGPGPSDVNPSVLTAMARPPVGHLDPAFIQIMDEIKVMLRQLFRTENEMTFPISGPGSAGMEACLINLIEPGDEAVICVHGVFGNRLVEIADRCGAKVTRVDSPWGRPIEPDHVRRAVDGRSPRIVAIVHAETSTGVLQPLEEISMICHEAGALLVVDAVTSFCGVDLRVDDWNIDALYSGTQKCLSAPPGLSPVTFSPRAIEAIERRNTKVGSWFLDVSLLRAYWTGLSRAYHHTAPVNACFALHEALRLVIEEGLDNRIERHVRNHLLLRSGLESLGFRYLVDEQYRLPQLNSVFIPGGVDDAAARSRLLNEFGIEVGAGLGELTGKIWRIGLMGESSSEGHVETLLGALRTIL